MDVAECMREAQDALGEGQTMQQFVDAMSHKADKFKVYKLYPNVKKQYEDMAG